MHGEADFDGHRWDEEKGHPSMMNLLLEFLVGVAACPPSAEKVPI